MPLPHRLVKQIHETLPLVIIKHRLDFENMGANPHLHILLHSAYPGYRGFDISSIGLFSSHESEQFLSLLQNLFSSPVYFRPENGTPLFHDSRLLGPQGKLFKKEVISFHNGAERSYPVSG